MSLRIPLITLMLCVLLSGCGQDQYAIEREYYGVQKQAAAVMTNPEATPPAELQRAVDALQSFMTRYPRTNIAVDAEFTMARLYVAKKEFAKAQDEYKKIAKTYAKIESVSAEAVFLRGAAYEEEGDWTAAQAQYAFLLEAYPQTRRGLEAPMFIALRYKNKFQPDKMMSALREAITHYQSLSSKNPITPLDLQARLLIAQCYVELKEWASAAQTLEKALKDFKGKVRTENIMLDLANIYGTQIKDAAKARLLLGQVIRENPKTRSSQVAKAMLLQLEKDKP